LSVFVSSCHKQRVIANVYRKEVQAKQNQHPVGNGAQKPPHALLYSSTTHNHRSKEEKNMNKLCVMIGLIFSCLALLTSSNAEAKQIPWTASFSGSAVNTQSDTNHDGSKGSLLTGGFKSSLGSGAIQGVGEFTFSGPGTCPNGNAGFSFTLLPGTGHSVYRFDSTGDLLFLTLSSATACFDPITSIEFYSWEDTITGGTGKFVGATGSSTGNGKTSALFGDTEGNFFAEFSSTIEGTLITPSHGGHD
jgi:hypothetical protein